MVFSVYLGMFLYVMGQKPFYLDLLRGVTGPSLLEEQLVASA